VAVNVVKEVAGELGSVDVNGTMNEVRLLS
jgi:hypothetical protein